MNVKRVQNVRQTDMEIIIQVESRIEADNLMHELIDTYKNIISKAIKTKHEIILCNDDNIRIIYSKYTDGISADIAIGENANEFTMNSKEEKSIWNYADLYDYLNKIKE